MAQSTDWTSNTRTMKSAGLLGLIAGLLLVLFGCTGGGSGGGSTGRKTDEDYVRDIETVAPQPTEAMAARAGVSMDLIGRGWWVFQRKCLECHEAKKPADLSRYDWHPVVEGMSENAGLSKDEYHALHTYLRAVAAGS